MTHPKPSLDQGRCRLHAPMVALRGLAAGLVVVVMLSTAAGCSGSDPESTAPSRTSKPTASSTTSSTTASTGSTTEVTDPSGGCGTVPDVATIGADLPGDVEQTFATGSTERVYRLAVPTDYDPTVPVPLVVNLHGSGSNAIQASIYGGVPHAATDRDMLVVAPEAVDGRWELGPGSDTDFIEALIDDIENRYCVDQDRVHLMGMSLGAWKAAATACALKGRFASIALITVEVFPGGCEPMPVVAFHGTADPTVAYGEGGGTVDDAVTPNAGLPGALDNIAAWAASNSCDVDPDISAIGGDVELRRFTGCEAGADAELYTIKGGGHTWPGSDIVIGRPELTTQTIDATKISLDWFEDHPRSR